MVVSVVPTQRGQVTPEVISSPLRKTSERCGAELMRMDLNKLHVGMIPLIQTMISVRENSEVVIINPDITYIYINNIIKQHIKHNI